MFSGQHLNAIQVLLPKPLIKQLFKKTKTGSHSLPEYTQY